MTSAAEGLVLSTTIGSEPWKLPPRQSATSATLRATERCHASADGVGNPRPHRIAPRHGLVHQEIKMPTSALALYDTIPSPFYTV